MEKTDTPLVSVIVPGRNAGKTIARTLASICSQTYENIEIVIVDDGSTDNTHEEVSRFATRDSRVQLYSQPHLGVAAARNLAVEKSRGVFVAPIDADDLWHPTKLEKQVARMNGRDQVGIVYAWSRVVNENDLVIRSQYPLPITGFVFPLMVIDNFIGNGSSPLIRRMLLEVIGGYDASLRARSAEGSEDWKMQLLIAERAEFDVVPEYLVGYRAHPARMSSDPGGIARSKQIVLGEIKGRHPELPAFVYRWLEARLARRAARHVLARGDFAAALQLIVKSLSLDFVGGFIAGLVFALSAVALPLRILRRALLPTPKKAIGRPFLEVDPCVVDWVAGGWTRQRDKRAMEKLLPTEPDRPAKWDQSGGTRTDDAAVKIFE